MIYKRSVVSVFSEYELRLKSQWNHIIDYEKILKEFESKFPQYRKTKKENYCVVVKHSFLFGFINIEKRVFVRAKNWKQAGIFATMSKREIKKNAVYQNYLKETIDDTKRKEKK